MSASTFTASRHGPRGPTCGRPLIEGEARDGFGFILKGNVNDLGYQSITVPGSLKAYAEAHEAWGRMPWPEILAPAIAHDQGGGCGPASHVQLVDQ